METVKKTVSETFNLQNDLHKLMDDLTNLYAASRAARCENTRAHLTNLYTQKVNVFLEKVSILDRATFIEKVLDSFFQKRIQDGMPEIIYQFYYALANTLDRPIEGEQTSISAVNIFLKVVTTKSDDGKELRLATTKIIQIE